MITKAVATNIQALSPLLGVGGAAAAAPAAAAGTAVGAAGAAAGALASVAWASNIGVDESVGSIDAARQGATTPASAPATTSNANNRFISFPLERVCAGFAGAYAHDLFETRYEDLPVADLARVGRLFDRF